MSPGRKVPPVMRRPESPPAFEFKNPPVLSFDRAEFGKKNGQVITAVSKKKLASRNRTRFKLLGGFNPVKVPKPLNSSMDYKQYQGQFYEN